MTSRVEFQRFTPNDSGIIKPVYLDEPKKEYLESIDKKIRRNEQFEKIATNLGFNPHTVIYLVERDEARQYWIRLIKDADPAHNHGLDSELSNLGHRYKPNPGLTDLLRQFDNENSPSPPPPIIQPTPPHPPTPETPPPSPPSPTIPPSPPRTPTPTPTPDRSPPIMPPSPTSSPDLPTAHFTEPKRRNAPSGTASDSEKTNNIPTSIPRPPITSANSSRFYSSNPDFGRFATPIATSSRWQQASHLTSNVTPTSTLSRFNSPPILPSSSRTTPSITPSPTSQPASLTPIASFTSRPAPLAAPLPSRPPSSSVPPPVTSSQPASLTPVASFTPRPAPQGAPPPPPPSPSVHPTISTPTPRRVAFSILGRGASASFSTSPTPTRTAFSTSTNSTPPPPQNLATLVSTLAASNSTAPSPSVLPVNPTHLQGVIDAQKTEIAQLRQEMTTNLERFQRQITQLDRTQAESKRTEEDLRKKLTLADKRAAESEKALLAANKEVVEQLTLAKRTRTELQQIQTRTNELNDKIQQLTGESQAATSAKIAAEYEVARIGALLAESERSNGELQTQLDEATRNLDSLKDRAKQTETALGETKARAVQIPALEEKLKESLAAQEDAKRKVEEATGQFNAAEKENENLREKLRLKENEATKQGQIAEKTGVELQTLQQELSRARERIGELESKVDESRTSLESLNSKMSELQKELGRVSLAKSAAEDELGRIRDQLEKADEVNKSLQKKFEEVGGRPDQLSRIVEEKSDELAAANLDAGQIETLKEELRKASADKAAAGQTLAEIRDRLDAAVKHNRDLQEELRQAEGEAADQTQLANKTQAELEVLQKKLASAEERARTSENSAILAKKEAEARFQELEGKISTLQTEAERALAAKGAAEGEAKAIRDQLKQANEANKSLKKKFQEVSDNADELAHIVKEKSNQFELANASVQRIPDLEKQLVETAFAQTAAEKRATNIQEQLDIATKTNEALGLDLKNANERAEKEAQIAKNLQTKLDALQETLVALEKTAETQRVLIEEHTGNQANSAAIIADLQASLNEVNAQLDLNEEEKNKTSETIRDLTELLAERMDSDERIAADFDLELQRLEKQLKEDLEKEYGATLQDLREKLENLTAIETTLTEQLDSQLKKYRESLESLRQQHAENTAKMKEEQEKTQEELQNTRRENVEIRINNEQLKGRITELLSVSVGELQDELERARTAITSLQERLATLSAEKQSLDEILKKTLEDQSFHLKQIQSEHAASIRQKDDLVLERTRELETAEVEIGHLRYLQENSARELLNALKQAKLSPQFSEMSLNTMIDELPRLIIDSRAALQSELEAKAKSLQQLEDDTAKWADQVKLYQMKTDEKIDELNAVNAALQKKLKEERDDASQKLEELQTRNKRLTEAQAQKLNDSDSDREKFNDLSERLAEAERKLAEAERQLADSEKIKGVVEARLSEMNDRLNAEKSKQQSHLAKITQMERRVASIELQLSQLKNRLPEKQSKLEEANQTLLELEKELQELRTEVTEAKSEQAPLAPIASPKILPQQNRLSN